MKYIKLSPSIFTKVVVISLLLPIAFITGCGSEGGSSFGEPTAAGVGTGLDGFGRGPSPVNLGTAGNFAILAQTGITNIPTSAITGNIGVHPATGAGITGITCTEITGTVYSTDAASDPGAPCTSYDQGTLLGTAIIDKSIAYTDAGSRAPDYTELASGSIGGLNLGPATYKWSTAVLIASDIQLTGGANDVWIFQISQGLSLSSGVKIILAGGALAKNVYWKVVAAADLGTTSVVQGSIISATSIVVKTGASVNGKLLAGTNVTLDKNVVTKTP